ncbi:MAG: hypothetical protein IKB20_01375 [Clostridia bacterium]|nr:hypothetical protein [Clostridia bacterium]
MNKKHTFKKTTALLMGVALAVGATGCGFISTDSQKDLEQVVATVDITSHLKNAAASEYKAQADNVAKVVSNLSKDITKRDLISAFLTTGYQYVQNYGYTYEATFNMLLDNLVNREIMVQYAVAYYLAKNTALTVDSMNAYVAAEKNNATEKEKAKYEKYPEVLTLKYFLTENGAEVKDYEKAVYDLKKSFNDSLDSLEAAFVTESDEEHDHEEARTLPTGVEMDKEDYYVNDYSIWTGRNALSECKNYDPIDGSTVTSRQKAYNAFLTNLQGYNLVDLDNSDGVVEDVSDITGLNYYYVELSSLLEQSLIDKYFEDLKGEVNLELNNEYMQDKYTAYKAQNERDYKEDPSAFGTALDGANEDTFVLYGLEGFGYVYNILIPFSTSQTVRYNEAKNRGLSQSELYVARRTILDQIKGKDLRTSWISEHDHANHSFEEDGKYYFFKENVKDGSKEKLSHYAGNYAFNGEVDTTGDEWEIEAYSVSIDDFIGIFEAQINAIDGVTTTTVDSAISDDTHDYYTTTQYKKADGKYDYSKFVYYEGQVNFTETPTAAGFFNAETQQYKVLSAVNELMFAYSTDTGCLNTYMGYSVSPYGTQFVKEFEYAAQQVVKNGVGSYMVCATDYGWHIIYCSFAYKAGYIGTEGDVYGGYVETDKDVEGTFSNLFYESVKESAYNNYANEKQNKVLLEFNNDTTVTRFQKRYQDLLDLDK